MDAKFRELERRVQQGDPDAVQPFWTLLKALYEPAALDGDIDAWNTLNRFANEHRLVNRQPDWVFLDNLGDVNFLDHGGFLIFIDRNWTYNAEVEVVEILDDRRRTPVMVSRFGLESFTYENGVLSDNEFHPDHAVWFADDLERVANAMGADPEEMIEDLVGGGRNVRDRAFVYRDLVAYYGTHEFDSDPLYLSRKEARERYKDILDK